MAEPKPGGRKGGADQPLTPEEIAERQEQVNRNRWVIDEAYLLLTGTKTEGEDSMNPEGFKFSITELEKHEKYGDVIKRLREMIGNARGAKDPASEMNMGYLSDAMSGYIQDIKAIVDILAEPNARQTKVYYLDLMKYFADKIGEPLEGRRWSKHYGRELAKRVLQKIKAETKPKEVLPQLTLEKASSMTPNQVRDYNADRKAAMSQKENQNVKRLRTLLKWAHADDKSFDDDAIDSLLQNAWDSVN